MSFNSVDELLAAISATEGGRDAIDPATGEVFAQVPVATAEDLEDAVNRAEAAQVSWGKLSHAERSDYLNKAADAIEASSEALAVLLSREQGKPLNGPNARFEVEACVGWIRANAAFELEPEVIVEDDKVRSEMHYDPIGIVGAISPWNWPMMISIWQWAPSLRMGNTVVAKPASSTTLSVLALAAVMNEALPKDVLIVVPANSKVGAALSSHPKVGKIMFTGSTEVGKIIARDASGSIARLTLELGGNDAGIVLPGTDVKAIAEDLFWGAFINTGQTCAAMKRLYVHEDDYDAAVEAIVEVAKNAPMGNGLDEQNVLGPLQNKGQYEVVSKLVDAARDGGATIALGGNPDDSQPGYFYPTTIVSDIDNDNPLVAEEQFGPALPIIKYSDLDQAVEWANGLDVGLGSSVWGTDSAQAVEVAKRLEAGTTWINGHGGIDPRIPFGGAKSSGYGLEFGDAGLKAVAQPHVITINK
ncbi:aldehyde dehydrogenase family protein [Gulosibacter molinativorax]|uniref:Aldehyde dehydrogenase n=1 Tax=Gulosibacter molinativorax TaxID=256821 RepID=A0ABT7CA53_9MICO|nr:aldehyde dehydrogenase family protein [Gulosibacter molinativorax]MDJ1372040.1 aldehyde dehydrogenase [Gulosibacter molinativorax]QUY63912.1 Phenylacetaldehyde dehydrogenase [Gulosibacter molinativorax]